MFYLSPKNVRVFGLLLLEKFWPRFFTFKNRLIWSHWLPLALDWTFLHKNVENATPTPHASAHVTCDAKCWQNFHGKCRSRKSLLHLYYFLFRKFKFQSANKWSLSINFAFKEKDSMTKCTWVWGSGGGSVGRAVASDTRGLRFVSIFYIEHLVYCQL